MLNSVHQYLRPQFSYTTAHFLNELQSSNIRKDRGIFLLSPPFSHRLAKANGTNWRAYHTPVEEEMGIFSIVKTIDFASAQHINRI